MQHDPDRNGDEPEPNYGTTTATKNISHPLWPRLPDGVRVHEDVDLTLDDPAAVDYTVNAGHAKNARRRCVAARLDEQRCASRAMHTLLVCALHAGRMTPEQGHTAKRTRRQERERHAQHVLALQSMGTRALIAETLASQAGNVQKAVVLLCEAAGKGDLAAAKALVPYFDQALGKPTERVEFRQPSTLEELEALSDEDLQRLVAQGRADRLAREREEADEFDDDEPDWRVRSVE